MDLDFSGLTDDQLLALIRAACAEAVTRGTAMESAARDAYMTADERVQIARAAADREVERIRQEETARVAREAAERVRGEVEQNRIESAEETTRKLWSQKKGIAEALRSIFLRAGYNGVGGVSVNVWLSRTSEQRVYIGAGYDTKYITYYATGGEKNAPGKLVLGDSDFRPMRDEIRSFCAALAATWTTIKFDAREALNWSGDPTPLDGYTSPPPEEAKVESVEPTAPVLVTLPVTLAPRAGIEGIRCLDCASWAHDGNILVHGRSCPTKAAIPDGYVRPPIGAAP